MRGAVSACEIAGAVGYRGVKQMSWRSVTGEVAERGSALRWPRSTARREGALPRITSNLAVRREGSSWALVGRKTSRSALPRMGAANDRTPRKSMRSTPNGR